MIDDVHAVMKDSVDQLSQLASPARSSKLTGSPRTSLLFASPKRSPSIKSPEQKEAEILKRAESISKAYLAAQAEIKTRNENMRKMREKSDEQKFQSPEKGQPTVTLASPSIAHVEKIEKELEESRGKLNDVLEQQLSWARDWTISGRAISNEELLRRDAIIETLTRAVGHVQRQSEISVRHSTTSHNNPSFLFIRVFFQVSLVFFLEKK